MIDLQKITISTIRSGKGDCIHLRFVSDKPYNIIIDTGPSSAAGHFRCLCETILKSGEDIDCLLIHFFNYNIALERRMNRLVNYSHSALCDYTLYLVFSYHRWKFIAHFFTSTISLSKLIGRSGLTKTTFCFPGL